MTLIVEILPKLYMCERSNKICMNKTPAVQNRVTLACCFCTVQTKPPLCTEI